MVKTADMVSKDNGVAQEIVLEKFPPGCVIVFRWVSEGAAGRRDNLTESHH